MSNVVVIVFDTAEEGSQARARMKELENQGLLTLDDAAVIVKDAEGNITVRNELDTPIAQGALVGSVLGLMVGFLFFPLGGLALGAAGGALVGKSLDRGIDKKFVEQVKEKMHPDSSALFLFIRRADPTAALAALKPFKGTVYHTSLSTSLDEQLESVLKDRK
jgi:uncharacterized membrane protein